VVPPVAETVIEMEPVLHTLVEVALAESTVGWITVTLVVALQLFASDTVKVYVPAVLVKLPVPV
jgi:hypothetical protein